MMEICFSFMPRVVMAGVPRRTPLVIMGFCGSYGMVFLFTVMPALSSACSASRPVMFLARRSTLIRWQSVPPLTCWELYSGFFECIWEPRSCQSMSSR